MGRKYELKRRAERQEETRQRIVDAAIALHTTIGPAHTSVSAVADRAGVQRHTVYSHFPDERALGLACSACHTGRHPLPDPDAWASMPNPERRLRAGLGALYAYYAKHGEEFVPILRDAEVHAPTREMVELRLRPGFERIRDALVEPFAARGARRERLLALVELFLDLHTWRTLSRSMPAGDVVEVAVRAVWAQASSRDGGPLGQRPRRAVVRGRSSSRS
ncbi:MAG: TetR/AcrR family transcriptional regulator [Vicinamibacteraceae bacterium]|nr:TetR/AcrR family transcriptional regulator [Vicinamibacteraceae bacterium]